ncbi:hypothetical protein SDRG_17281 [Saprolegnia diclina VS20]|uniref:AMP-dependent synthetase/ligase domain-containing protein n=1 Tax=Saprolegnia diclina (strain VS20) TaxID=1156394 RepID=T0R5Q1_SAPDV|nr:hypothetical protein SDRG_17281 [Saprolegnia diclina VS20]EQC24827.1 hypothetical protein SDRG_17281 [Saprolegnia diclina VS20]|eukprot:XP_008621743.1 hypothetical protein SDRG_17281 [Saprolegnia diclina VS20]
MVFGISECLEPPAMYAAVDAASATPGHGPVYTSVTSKEALPTTMTLVESLAKTVATYPDRPFVGHRPLDANNVAGPYTWQTYAECATRIQNFGSGLVTHNMLEPTDDGHKFLGIYMKNRPEWVLSQYAAYHAGAAVVPIYDTLGVTSTAYILNQTGVTTVVCTSAELENLLAKATSTTTLRHVILADVTTLEAAMAERASAAGLRLWTLLEIEAAGASTPAATVRVSDVCVLMYTSGTTGDPKGAMITHGSLNAACHGMLERFCMSPSVAAMLKASPSVLSFLPLAHVAEQALEATMIVLGGAIGFYQGNTLKLLEDVQALRPTLFLGVPRLLNKIHDKVTEGAAAAGGIKAWLFQTALNTKLANLAYGQTSHAIYDALIFSALKAKLGLDRCELLVTGAAPLPAHVLSFFRVLLNCTCTELYGMTEATSATNMTDYRDLDAGTVGPPLISADVKLVSVPDMGYNVTDTVHGEGDAAIAVKGRGEVCIRGPTVFSGYFKAPEKTKEAIDEDGWLHSGDIGVWTTDGRLKLVDRKKNIFKLSQGDGDVVAGKQVMQH